jgi:hypothetical protein
MIKITTIIILIFIIYINNSNCINRKKIISNEKLCNNYALHKSNIIIACNNVTIINKCLNTNNKTLCNNITNYDLYVSYKKECIQNENKIYRISCIFVFIAFILIPYFACK